MFMFLAEHMLFMGSTEFPDENEVSMALFSVSARVSNYLYVPCVRILYF